MLCGYSFGYPIGFNKPAFEVLKLALLKSMDASATAEQASRNPFYVIVLTRQHRNPLDNIIIRHIHKILTSLIHNSNEPVPNIQQTAGTVPTDMTTSLGLVITNEYFFSGKQPMHSGREAKIGEKFSRISPRYLFAINSLVQIQDLHTTTIAVPIIGVNAELFTQQDLIRRAKSTTHANYMEQFSQIYWEVPGAEALPLQSLVEIPPDLQKIHAQAASFDSITNRTIFWHNSIYQTSYCKNTYQSECDDEIMKGKLYCLGTPVMFEHTDSEIAAAIQNNIDIQICADHQYAIGSSATAKNFQILQSNQIQSIPQGAWIDEKGNAYTYKSWYEHVLFSSPRMIEITHELYKGAYFIHANGNPEETPYSKSMYQQEQPNPALPHYPHPSPACFMVQFGLTDAQNNYIPFCIEVYKIG
jgi:hypothetical protein